MSYKELGLGVPRILNSLGILKRAVVITLVPQMPAAGTAAFGSVLKVWTLRPHPRLLLSQNLHLNKMAGWFLSPFKFGKCWSRGCDLLTNEERNSDSPVVTEVVRTDSITPGIHTTQGGKHTQPPAVVQPMS